MFELSNFMILYNLCFFLIHKYIPIQVNESTVFLYENCELKHVSMVTDLRCLEKLGLGMKKVRFWISRDGLVVTMSASHVVGHGLRSWLGHTKDHLINGTNCLPVWHASIRVGVQPDSL